MKEMCVLLKGLDSFLLLTEEIMYQQLILEDHTL